MMGSESECANELMQHQSNYFVLPVPKVVGGATQACQTQGWLLRSTRPANQIADIAQL